MDQGRRPVGKTKMWFEPNEEFQLFLDPREGISFQLPDERDGLILTNQRLVRIGLGGGQRTITAVPLDHVDAVDVRHLERPMRPIYWSIFAVIVGIGLSIFMWVLLEAPLMAMLVGGVIAVAGLWSLLGHLLGKNESHLCFKAGGQSIYLPLYTGQSAEGAYHVCNRFFELAQLRRHPTQEPTEASNITKTASPGLPSEQAPRNERKLLLETLDMERTNLLGLIQHARLVPPTFIDKVAEQSPWEGEWSVKQTLAHIAEIERVLVAEAIRGAEGDLPEVGYSGEGQWGTAHETANQRPLNTILEEMALTRGSTIRAVHGIYDHELLKMSVRHRRMGEVTLLQLMQVIYRHDRSHADQVDRTLRALLPATSESTWDVTPEGE